MDVGMIDLLCLPIHTPYCWTNMRQSSSLSLSHNQTQCNVTRGQKQEGQ